MRQVSCSGLLKGKGFMRRRDDSYKPTPLLSFEGSEAAIFLPTASILAAPGLHPGLLMLNPFGVRCTCNRYFERSEKSVAFPLPCHSDRSEEPKGGMSVKVSGCGLKCAGVRVSMSVSWGVRVGWSVQVWG